MSSSECISTKQKLIALVEDIELITRQLFETLAQQQSRMQDGQAFGSQRMNQSSPMMNVNQLTDLLLAKNLQMEEMMKTAREQKQLHQQIEAYKAEIEQKDKEIFLLQKHFKEAENLLSTALYQAKEKMKSIKKAQESSVTSEEIIKYAHKISAACATAAPLNWVPGDTRRPYPQDIEMRCGWLGQLSNMTDANSGMKPTPQLGTEGLTMPRFSSNDTSSNTMDLHWGNQSLGSDGKIKKDEVEMMSSDSSSSSSSDSSFGD